MNVSDFEPLFTKIEEAVDAHPKLLRLTDNPVMSGASMSVNRLGFTAEIQVKLKGSRKKPSDIHGHGDTAEAAVDSLISALDFWAQAIE